MNHVNGRDHIAIRSVAAFRASLLGVKDSIKASATGLYDQAIRINSTEDVELITVFFHPYAASAVMGIPCKTLAYENVDFESLESMEFKALKRHVLDADSAEELLYGQRTASHYQPDLSLPQRMARRGS